MSEQWSGIERRLERLDDCTSKLEALADHGREDFDANPLLRDLAERNFEVAAQCVIDIAMRIISLEQAPRTSDAATAIRRLGELGVLEPAFAQELAPLAGFRNVLAHEYMDVDWSLVHQAFGRLDQLRRLASSVRTWLRDRAR